ncbi:MAG: DUF6695 family protein [Gelidibacter sp.]
MKNTGIIIPLAYPETIVRVSDEWSARYIYLLGFGKKNYVRAGHAALLLIEKSTGNLEYYDFGRYVTPQPTGRVRSKLTDHELGFSLHAEISNKTIINLDSILKFFATHPNLTHGEGTMLASVCDEIDYDRAKNHIDNFQNEGLIKYAVFGSSGSNCSRFVTDTLIASVTNKYIRGKLKKSKWFTPSTIGNVLNADTKNLIYKVSETGYMDVFNSSAIRENRKLFMDRLKTHQPNFEGNLKPKTNFVHHKDAQWMCGIGSGAWFELHCLGHDSEYRLRRISPHGNVDVDGIYKISEVGFNSKQEYEFVPYSNCNFIHLRQQGRVFRFDFLRNYEVSNSAQKAHLI